MNEITVSVTIKFKDNRSHVELYTPTSQERLTIEEMGMVLAGGLSLAIRSAGNQGVYMKHVMDYLTSEFINPDSFSDAKTMI